MGLPTADAVETLLKGKEQETARKILKALDGLELSRAEYVLKCCRGYINEKSTVCTAGIDGS